MSRYLPILAALVLVLALPFVFRPRQNLLAEAQDTVVIVTPNNEAIRYEFTRAFVEHYRLNTGRTVRLDWRTPGGTSEIARYLESEFEAAFRNYWNNLPNKPSGASVGDFDDSSVKLGMDPAQDTISQRVRRAFLESNVGIGIDIFFGGGSYDFSRQADAGRLVDCGVNRQHPGWFGEGGMPQSLGGEPFYDAQGRWFGTCVSSFGICFNRDSLARLGGPTALTKWSDLGEPYLRGEVALADPTKSGSIAKAFEMLIQEQMHREVATGVPIEDAKRKGWDDGLKLIQRMAGNARYFTDAASKIVVDVALGDAAAGMCIDFYGRQQAEAVADKGGHSRLQYITPVGGSSIGVDPIGLLRGAPNRAAALAFIEFVLSPDGQKLWNQRPGTPGGPKKYALRRLPVMPHQYMPELRKFQSDPDVNPYAPGQTMAYDATWTQPLLGSIRFVVRAMCLDAHDELLAAWEALVTHDMPPEALSVFQDVSRVSLENCLAIKKQLASKDKVVEVRLARELAEHFRAQYRKARELAIARR
jgi:ABC-type Fe3+ transport system substrate-binding protein